MPKILLQVIKGRNDGRCYTAANNKGNINQGITSIS